MGVGCTRMSYSYHEYGCNARFSHGATIPPLRSHPSLSSLVSRFPAHHYLHSANGTAATCLSISPFLVCSLPRSSAVVTKATQQIPNGPAKLTRLGVDRVGCKKQNRMILVQKPSHGVLLAERAGRESLVQSFQSGIRFLWLFAHESDR